MTQKKTKLGQAWALKKPLQGHGAYLWPDAVCGLAYFGLRERVSRAELERRTGIDQNTFGAWMAGTSVPNGHYIQRVAEQGYGVDYIEFQRLGREEANRIVRDERLGGFKAAKTRGARALIEFLDELRRDDPDVWLEVAEEVARQLKSQGEGGAQASLSSSRVAVAN